MHKLLLMCHHHHLTPNADVAALAQPLLFT